MVPFPKPLSVMLMPLPLWHDLITNTANGLPDFSSLILSAINKALISISPTVEKEQEKKSSGNRSASFCSAKT